VAAHGEHRDTGCYLSSLRR